MSLEISNFKGHHHTKESKKKIHDALIGRLHTEETKEKIRSKLKGRISPNKGNKHSDEAKTKISKALKGRKKPAMSNETKKKLSDINKGNKYCLGKHATREAKRKMRISAIIRMEKIRQDCAISNRIK